LRSVSSCALVVAVARGGVEGAESGGLAVGSGESGAGRSTCLVGVVPHTSGVGHAAGSGSVGVLTLLGALILHGSGLVEAAHGVGSAGLGVGGGIRGRGELVDAGAIASALVGGLIPHAAVGAGAGRGVGEEGGALHHARVAGFEVAELAVGAFGGGGDHGALLVAAAGGGLVEAGVVTHAVGL